ncbi:CAP domain-containing protein [uncultured Tateyamaria sp.]|uniref:CAP domain-containing protein n=1 Tax=uncultured Tateyamaria sp. TaxID=455651 RepID=UPI002628CA01|nr:CAP domain-containing protein [uncultured Tateyamaria sp.]
MSVASTFERQMLDLINEERTSRGLNPLTLELRLNDASEDHTIWMDQTGNFSHTGIAGSNPGERMDDAGFVFSGNWTWGENIAFQSERGAPGIADDVVDLHNALMNSPGHRANILNPNFELIGIGIELGDGRGYDAVYVTQNFARTSADVQLDTGGTPAPAPVPVAPEPVSEDDVLTGTAGNDRLDGGAGDDLVRGQAGDDALLGRVGNDTLEGGDGRDRIAAGDGDDIVRGGNENDTLDGGAGNDRLSGGAGNDRVKGGDGSDAVYGADGADLLTGNAGNDTLNGGNGRDTLDGGSGRDRLIGGAENDRLSGQAERDVLDGGSGRDILSGGTGDDVFVFSAGRDVVTDFDVDARMEVVDLRGVAAITSFADMLADGHLRQSGSHAVVDDLAGNVMILMNVDMNDLEASDFLF